MTTVFLGGSRSIVRLPPAAVERLDNIVRAGLPVVVGDAPGADVAIQRHLAAALYRDAMVFCSGAACRHNVGGWPIRAVAVAGGRQDFQFHATKDREMARVADTGLMIWDGASPGVALNVLRLVGAGKKAVLIDTRAGITATFRTLADWDTFEAGLAPDLRDRLAARTVPADHDVTGGASRGGIDG